MENFRTYQKLAETCIEMLTIIEPILHRVGQSHDIAHNFFWNSNLFGRIHGILLITTFSIYHYGIELDMVQTLLVKVKALNLIHPYMNEVITALSSAKQGDDFVLEQLKKCCFLVPNIL